MAGETLRTQTLYRVLDKLVKQADRKEEEARKWLELFGAQDRVASSDMVRVEAMRYCVEFIREELRM